MGLPVFLIWILVLGSVVAFITEAQISAYANSPSIGVVHKSITGVPTFTKRIPIDNFAIDVNRTVPGPQVSSFLGGQWLWHEKQFCARDSRPQYGRCWNHIGITSREGGFKWLLAEANIGKMGHFIGRSLSGILNLDTNSGATRWIGNLCSSGYKNLPLKYGNRIGNIENSATLGNYISAQLPFGTLAHMVESAQGNNNSPYSYSKYGPVINNRPQKSFAPVQLLRLTIGTALFFAGAYPRRRIIFGSSCSWFWRLLGKVLTVILIGLGLICLFWNRLKDASEQDSDNKPRLHSGQIVTRKHLTSYNLCNTVMSMANVLGTDKQIAVVGALAEGSSIRSIERMTGVHRDTIMRLGVRVGQGCARLMDAKMRDLPCTRLEMDEIWGFVGKKDRNVRLNEPRPVGNVWTFCAIDAETKLVPAFKVGDRDIATAKAFVSDVASRMRNRVQISTDGLRAYVEAVESAFGSEVDYAQIVKTYGREELNDNRRYSAPEFVSSEKKVIVGNPDERLISTSYVERLNATTRLHMRRLTRLTLAFSKKRENFEAAVALHFAYYNFVKRHNTLRCTPAMAAGVESDFWSVGNLVEAAA